MSGVDQWLLGDAVERLDGMEEGSVHLVVTSPPYWGLRDYGIEPRDWPEVVFSPMAGLPPITVPAQRAVLGLEEDAWSFVGHLVLVFRSLRRVLRRDGLCFLNLGDCFATGAGRVGEAPGGGVDGARWTGGAHKAVSAGEAGRHRDARRRDATAPRSPGGGKQGARWSGNAEGVEADMARNYGTSRKNRGERTRELREGREAGKHLTTAPVGPTTQPNRMPQVGLKPKDLVGMPWRVAFALQADGWYLRGDNVWAKLNPMPESVQDRATRAHEFVFQLALDERYFYDIDATREPHQMRAQRRSTPPGRITRAPGRPPDNGLDAFVREEAGVDGHPLGRNMRSVWNIATRPFTEAHFATMPPELAERCVLAGSSERGACPTCGAPWWRVVDRVFTPQADVGEARGVRGADGQKPLDASNGWEGFPRGSTTVTPLGWEPGCDCYGTPELPDYPDEPEDEDDEAAAEAWRVACEPVREERRRLLASWKELPVVPCVVLDPFGGAGTTALVSRQRGRRFRHIEVNQDYLGIAQRRLEGVVHQLDLFLGIRS